MFGTVNESAVNALIPGLAMLALLPGGCSKDAAAPDVLQIVPAPAAVERMRGDFRLEDGAHIVAADPRAEPVARYLADLLARTGGISLTVGANGDSKNGIRLSLEPATHASPEAYRLEVDGEGIAIHAADPRGLFYGAVTVWQLATANGSNHGPAILPALRIDDAPRFAWRGLMLDSARHYQPPAFIRELIDWMALHKLNVLHWHLTDDQGWRLEIRKYPRLTEVGA